MMDFTPNETELGEFDETEYRLANPDVDEAVKRGDITSGLEHYTKWGKAEHRQLKRGLRPLLSGLRIAEMRGVEIGALCHPVVRKEDGNVLYVDYADQAYLKDHYKDDPGVNTDDIVQVDAVWGKQSLSEALQETSAFDYVLASHVIEHVPDMVTWLQEIGEILKPEGQLRLAIPDKRFCFDVLRTETALYDLLDAYIRRARAPTPRAVLDYCLNVRHVDTAALWARTTDPLALVPIYTPEDALAIARSALAGAYHDVHCWVFTPTSFRHLMSELCRLGLITLGCDFVVPTKRDSLEFFVSLSKKADADAAYRSWIEAAA